MLTYYFDYSSPWSYLGFEQLQKTVDSVSPITVTIEWVPILLGALFKTIGTPMVRMHVGVVLIIINLYIIIASFASNAGC